MTSQSSSRNRSLRGCATCRLRKVRCGEETPECSNCLRLGFQCCGYTKTFKWLSIQFSDHDGREVTVGSLGSESQQVGARRRDLFSCKSNPTYPLACILMYNGILVPDRAKMTCKMTNMFPGPNVNRSLNNALNDIHNAYDEAGKEKKNNASTFMKGPFGVFKIGNISPDVSSLEDGVNAAGVDLNSTEESILSNEHRLPHDHIPISPVASTNSDAPNEIATDGRIIFSSHVHF